MMGKKKNDIGNAKMRNQIRWNDVVYHQGYLEAIARNKGKVVARHRIETTGAAAKLTATADNPVWQADGTDLQHVRIVAVDKNGRRVQTTDEEVTFAVEGDARIVGVVNGDINSDEMMIGNKRRLYNGTRTVILRSSRKAGPVVLKAFAPNMKPTKIKLNMQ